jgi:putative flippase GtrA
MPRIPSNICSTSIAMAFSFSANFFVFQPTVLNTYDQATKFILVTATSLYIIQNLAIYITTNIWNSPSKTAYTLIKKINPTKNWSESFISKNTVKLIATGCSLIWNFLWYRFYVYQ